MSGGYTLTLAA